MRQRDCASEHDLVLIRSWVNGGGQYALQEGYYTQRWCNGDNAKCNPVAVVRPWQFVPLTP